MAQHWIWTDTVGSKTASSDVVLAVKLDDNTAKNHYLQTILHIQQNTYIKGRSV